MTSIVRVPTDVHTEAKRIAALQGQATGEVIAAAWREYLANHREEFASDLEEAARLMRDGTLDQLAEFASRHAEARAEASVNQGCQPVDD
jgi:hypothetical protein